MTTERKTELNPQVAADVMAALSVANLPDVHWLLGDDRCDCIFQRIGEWTNPYVAHTLRIRMCCIWKELGKMFPQHVQEIGAYYDENTHTYETEPRAWDNEEIGMPVYLWLRQMAVQTGKSLAELREEYRDRLTERPKAVPQGTGWQSRNQPSEATVRAAREAQMKASGWLLEGESL